MPRLELQIVVSETNPGCVSLRTASGGKARELREEITAAGFQAGDRVVLIPAELLEQLEVGNQRAAAGRKGGLTTRSRHGTEHYSTAGRKGGAARKAALGPNGFAAMGRKGAEAKRAKAEKA